MYRFLIILMVSSLSTLFADQRHFVWTYEAFTVPRGEAELEVYHTIRDYPAGNPDFRLTLENELEIGMTHRFDVGLYQVFRQDTTGGLSFNSYKIRGRYRLTEPGRFFLDPLAYVEFKQALDKHEQELEFKLLLGHEDENWRLALNTVAEVEFEDDETEWGFKQMIAAGIHVWGHWHLGAELELKPDNFRWGPTLAHGGEHLWAGWGVFFPTKNDEGNEWRLILGVGL